MEKIKKSDTQSIKCSSCKSGDGYLNFEKLVKNLWEEHHLDLSKSIINPNFQYQGVFKLFLENDKKFELKRICLPRNWFLYGENIIKVRVNNMECVYYKCIHNNEHLIIDLPIIKNIDNDSVIFLIVDLQNVMEYYSNLYKEQIYNLYPSLKEKIKLELEIEPFKIASVYRSKERFFHMFPQYHSSFTTISDNQEDGINDCVLWVKIPKICKFKLNNIYFFDDPSEIMSRSLLKFIDIVCRRKFRRYIHKFIDKKINSTKFTKKLKDLNILNKRKAKKVITNYDSVKNKIKLEESDISNLINTYEKKYINKPRKKKILYQLTREDYHLYHHNESDFKNSFKWESIIVFNRKTKWWVRFHLILMAILIIFACTYFFNKIVPIEIVQYFFTNLKFEIWDFFKFAITISIFSLIALTW